MGLNLPFNSSPNHGESWKEATATMYTRRGRIYKRFPASPWDSNRHWTGQRATGKRVPQQLFWWNLANHYWNLFLCSQLGVPLHFLAGPRNGWKSTWQMTAWPSGIRLTAESPSSQLLCDLFRNQKGNLSVNSFFRWHTYAPTCSGETWMPRCGCSFEEGRGCGKQRQQPSQGMGCCICVPTKCALDCLCHSGSRGSPFIVRTICSSILSAFCSCGPTTMTG